jgi:predicted nucleic acid-binding protein
VRVILDTSVFIAAESGRPLASLPDDAETAISVMTVAELRVGVLRADDPLVRARRLASLEVARRDHDVLPVDDDVADRFAEVATAVRAAGRNPRVVDTLIAATALVHGAAVATQDADFQAMPGVEVILL